ncbi:hypothetical protein D3C80_1665550 [compost metagenome]
MTGELEAAQHQEWHQVADVQAAGGGIEAAIEDARHGQMIAQGDGVGILGDKPALAQLVQQMGVEHGVSNDRGKAAILAVRRERDHVPQGTVLSPPC